ncbi:YegP family protein [Chryseobacterium sp.]|uniref:YegP family protein n=1 Tax=Chryseobacterium sp. TaxID=1871047 RepID=UPI0025BAD1FA|nr:YegP family protein [Chryseobacterium sp.]MBV8327188.1 YegP family protein [Chryseobacterium sp.]
MGKFIISRRINNEYQFNQKAGNREIIGKSQLYSPKTAMENGIASVKNKALDAEIIDTTL